MLKRTGIIFRGILMFKGELRYTKVGIHRRIRLSDLIAYKDKIRKQSAKAMDELVSIAQENNLGS